MCAGRCFRRRRNPDPTSFEQQSAWANQRKPRCVRSGSLKLIEAPYLDHRQLYDLSQDPLERRNLARDHPDLCRSLRQRLAAWRDDAGRHLAEVRAASAAGR